MKTLMRVVAALMVTLSGHVLGQVQHQTTSAESLPMVSWTRILDVGPPQRSDGGHEIHMPSFVASDSSGHLFAAWASYAENTGAYCRVVKLDPAGNVEWELSHILQPLVWNGSEWSNWPAGLRVDNEGNAIVAGMSYGRIFITKISSDGKALWSRRWPEIDTLRSDGVGSYGLAVGDQGHIYASRFNAFDLRPSLLSYNRDGTLLWSRTLPGEWRSAFGDDSKLFQNELMLDQDENIYMAGEVVHDSTFESTIGIVKYDRHGTLQWIKKIRTGTGDCSLSASGLVVGRDGSVYCGVVPRDELYGLPIGSIIASLSTEGDERWVQRDFPENMVGFPPLIESIFLDGEGNLRVNRGMFSCLYDSTGRVIWQREHSLFQHLCLADGDVVWDVSSEDGTVFLGCGSPDGSSDRLQILNWQPFVSNWLLLSSADKKRMFVSGRSRNDSMVVIALDRTVTTVRDISESVPAAPGLLNNYPNPFNPSTDIRFQIPDNRHVRLSITDLLGREIALLVNEELTPGIHTATWDAAGMPSGIYFCRLEAISVDEGSPSTSLGTRFVDVKKMVLLR